MHILQILCSNSFNDLQPFSLNDGTVQYYPEARNGVLVKADITFKGEPDQDLISDVSIYTNNYYKALKDYLKVRDLALWISQK